MCTLGPMPRVFRNASSVTALSARATAAAASNIRKVRTRMRALWRNAQVTAAAFDKTQSQMLVARQPDARADLDGRPAARAAFEPQHVAGAQIDARKPAADAERRAQSPGTAREIRDAHVRTTAPHPFDTFERLER